MRAAIANAQGTDHCDTFARVASRSSAVDPQTVLACSHGPCSRVKARQSPTVTYQHARRGV
eukprot:11842676-Alexandrium_andersonii.AAC.1